jgi:segregation and condensation protein A
MSDYRVELDVYNGPLDLLLYLIRRDEVDVYDIPIARVTQQYVNYCNTLTMIDPNLVGEFLVMAATLMEIKSRLLLPRPPAAEIDETDWLDPRDELVRQLLEYKQFKDVSDDLSERAQEQFHRWPRGGPEKPPTNLGEVDLEDVQLWDLVGAFTRVLSATGRGPVTHDVIVDDTPIALHAADIVDRLVREGSMLFSRIFTGRNRGEMIGLFLALLELIREKRVRVAQNDPLEDISLVLLSAEPIEIGEDYTGLSHLQPHRFDADDADGEDENGSSVPLLQAAEHEDDASDGTLAPGRSDRGLTSAGDVYDDETWPADDLGDEFSLEGIAEDAADMHDDIDAASATLAKLVDEIRPAVPPASEAVDGEEHQDDIADGHPELAASPDREPASDNVQGPPRDASRNPERAFAPETDAPQTDAPDDSDSQSP